MNILEIKNLSFSYGGEPVLENICLNVKEKEFVTIVGPNGSGKSTLVKCICNILDSNRSVSLFGKTKEEYSSGELAKIISYVPQSLSGDFRYTVWEFLLMSRYAYLGAFSSLSKSDYDACAKALALTDTEKYKNRIMSGLSGGERQKILVAAAVAQESEIMLLDEPATYLDPKHVAETMKIIKKANENCAVVTVTHDLNSIFMGDRVVAVKEGKIVFDNTPIAFFESKSAEKIFDTEFLYIKEEENYYILPKHRKL